MTARWNEQDKCSKCGGKALFNVFDETEYSPFCPHCGAEMDNALKCSLCGEPMNIWDSANDFAIHKKIGFGSEFDGQVLDIKLCNMCMDKIIRACQINPLQERG